MSDEHILSINVSRQAQSAVSFLSDHRHLFHCYTTSSITVKHASGQFIGLVTIDILQTPEEEAENPQRL